MSSSLLGAVSGMQAALLGAQEPEARLRGATIPVSTPAWKMEYVTVGGRL